MYHHHDASAHSGPGPGPSPAAAAAAAHAAPAPSPSWPTSPPRIYDSTAWPTTTTTRAPHRAALASATVPPDHAASRHNAWRTHRANAPDGPLPPPWPPTHPRGSSSTRDPRDYYHDYYAAPPTHAAGRDRDYPAYALPPPAHSAAELAAAARRFDGSAGRTAPAVHGADSATPAAHPSASPAYASPPQLATLAPRVGPAQPDGPPAVDPPHHHPWPQTTAATDGLVRAYLPYDPAPMRGASALVAGAAAALAMPSCRAEVEAAARVGYAPPPPPLPPPARGEMGARPGWGERESEWHAPPPASMYGGHGAPGSYRTGPYAGPPPSYSHAPGPYYDGWGAAPPPPAGWHGPYPEPASAPRYAGDAPDRDSWGPRPPMPAQDARAPAQYAPGPYSDREYADQRFPADQTYADSRYPASKYAPDSYATLNYAPAPYSTSNYAPAAYPTSSDYVPAPMTDSRFPPAPPCPPAPESPTQYAYPSFAHDALPHEAAPRYDTFPQAPGYDGPPRPVAGDAELPSLYPPVPALPEPADPAPAAQLPVLDAPKAKARANRRDGHDDDDDDDDNDRASEADVQVTGKRAPSDGDGDGDGGKARRHYTEFTKFTYELMVASLVAGPRGGRWGAARKHTTPIDVVRSALHASLRHPPGADPSTIASAPHDPTCPLRIFTLEEALRLAAATRAPPHELAGISRKKWARLKASLRIVPGRPLYRCLAWVGGEDAILAPREDWDSIVRDAHLHRNEATGMVEHRSLKQTFLAVKEVYQTRRSRSGIGYEACEVFCQGCVCYGALDRTAATTGGATTAPAGLDAGAVPAE
ncbi:hypothetical protein GGF32_003893 [Allomyces javanicus]|nr:hypothetical protein GGF32_003893 [Allomyces javanicus]